MIPTPHIIESALLLLLAFVLGCAVGYFLRRIFPRAAPAVGSPPVIVADTAAPGSEASVSAASVEETTQTGPTSVAASTQVARKLAEPKKPAKRATPKPAAPRTITPKSAAQPKPKAAKIAAPPLVDTPDDLKKISGIGPKLEAILQKNGISTYAQISSWKRKDIIEMDARLSLRGRIERDDWVGQAKTLVKVR